MRHSSSDSQSRLNRNTLLLLKRKNHSQQDGSANCVDDEFADKLVTWAGVDSENLL